jgi:hypothetical protein
LNVAGKLGYYKFLFVLLLSEQKTLYLERTHTMKSFTCSSALMSLALVAMVATTANAQTVPTLGTTTAEIGLSGSPAGWSNLGSNASNGYNFVYSSIASATGTGALDNSSPGDHVILQGVKTLPVSGSSFLALDGDFNLGGNGGVPVGATISGLTSGDVYSISYWASDSQQLGFTGATSDDVTACVGGSTGSPQTGTCSPTGVVNDPNNQGANPTNSQQQANPNDTAWVQYTFNFTANGSSELLSFLDVGTPTNPQEPAFALIDGISVTQVPPSTTPEPSSLMLLGTGLAGLSGLVRSRFKKAAKV